MCISSNILFFQTCENILTESAASECLKMLSDMLGKSIFRARIENYNPRLVCFSVLFIV